MKPLIKHLDKIKELRFEHSRCFAAFQYDSMQRAGEKIQRAWADYDIARQAAFMAQVCFTCGGKPNAEFTVESSGRLPMLFCSDNCRMTFGVSLGLT